MLTKGAMGNLVNRYRAVLKKCTLINVFGSLAVASMLVMGGASCANAVELSDLTDGVTFKNGTATVNPVSGKYVAGKQVEAGTLSPLLDSTSITLTDQNFKGELNAGSLAFGDGVTATVRDASITITGGSFDGTPDEGEPFPIRGGGIAADGGSSTVEKSTISISGAELKNTLIWAGGVAVAEEDGTVNGKAITNASTINLENTTASDVTVYGGSDGGHVGTSAINVSGSSKVETIFAGGDNDTVDDVTITVGEGSRVHNIITNGSNNSQVKNATIVINGGELLGYKGNAIYKEATGGTTENLNIELNGGTINGNVIADAGTATISVKDDAGILGDVINNSGSTGLEVADGANMTVAKGDVVVDTLTAASGATILVGNSDSAGRLFVDKATLNGAGVFLDPAWKDDPSADILDNASHAVFGGSTVDGKLTAGQNSLLVLGDTSSDWAMNAFKESGLSWGKNGITAALAVASSQTLESTGSLLVDGSLTSARFANPGDATFADQSLLMVNGTAASGSNAALTGKGSGTLTVQDGARLYIRDAGVGTYTITSKFNKTDLNGWQDENLVLNRLVSGTTSLDENGNVIVTTKADDISQLYPGIHAVNSLNALSLDSNSNDMGVRFLSRAMDPTMLADSAVTDTVNEVSQSAVTAGVQNTSLRLSDAASDTVLHHLSLGNHDSGNNIHQDGVDMWATPMYGNTYMHGMGASGTAVRGNYGGIAFGADTQIGEVAGGKVRVGVALNGGGGKSETRGTATSTENSYNFGGINLYSGWNLNNLNVMASLGYSIGDHDVEMNLPSSMRMGQAKADIDTGMFTADLRAEYQIKTNWLDILPHAGVRYTSLHTDSYNLKVNGSTLNSVKADTQNIVQFPVGVTVTKNIDAGGWNIKPQADVSVIPAAGEKKAFTRAHFSGVDAMDGINSRIMDSTSWAGMVGLQAEKGNLSLGLNYGVQASSHETDQGVRFTLGWKF